MVCQACVAALSVLLILNLAIFRQKIVLNPKLQASRCEILRLDVSLRTLQTPRCECEDGFSRPGPPLSQALHFELSTQNGKDQAYSQYIYGFGCRMRLEITAPQASASAGSSARNG